MLYYYCHNFPNGQPDFPNMLILQLEIHACNNPSPVLKRCILSAVASTSSQGGGVRLDRGGGWWLPKCFQMYKNIVCFQTVVFQFTFSCPENYLNSPENLLKFYINLSALEIYLKFLMSNYHGVAPPPPPPVSLKQTLSDLFNLPKCCASYSRAFCCCHALAWFKFMNFYYIKYSVL